LPCDRAMPDGLARQPTRVSPPRRSPPRSESRRLTVARMPWTRLCRPAMKRAISWHRSSMRCR
jgi:hypothetical protein